METCPHCKKEFEVEVPNDLLGYKTLQFECPFCNVGFLSEQLEKLVWKRDALSGTWYTTLVPRHTKIDGINLMRFDYYDYLKDGK